MVTRIGVSTSVNVTSITINVITVNSIECAKPPAKYLVEILPATKPINHEFRIIDIENNLSLIHI